METGNLGLASVWIPLEMTTSGVGREVRGAGAGREIRGAMVTGRLRDGVTLAEAQAEGSRIGEELAAEYPVTNRGWILQVRTTDYSLLGDSFSIVMTLLILTVGFVLLIACANVANLVLVRASSRMRELALLSSADVSIGQRHLEVLGDGEIVQQVVTLEDEPDVLLAERLPVLELERVYRLADEIKLSGPGGVVHAEDV